MRIIWHWVLHFYDVHEIHKNWKSIVYKICNTTFIYELIVLAISFVYKIELSTNAFENCSVLSFLSTYLQHFSLNFIFITIHYKKM